MTGDSEDITDCNPGSGNCRGAAGQSNNVRYQDFGVPRNTLIAESKGGIFLRKSAHDVLTLPAFSPDPPLSSGYSALTSGVSHVR